MKQYRHSLIIFICLLSLFGSKKSFGFNESEKIQMKNYARLFAKNAMIDFFIKKFIKEYIELKIIENSQVDTHVFRDVDKAALLVSTWDYIELFFAKEILLNFQKIKTEVIIEINYQRDSYPEGTQFAVLIAKYCERAVDILISAVSEVDSQRMQDAANSLTAILDSKDSKDVNDMKESIDSLMMLSKTP